MRHAKKTILPSALLILSLSAPLSAFADDGKAKDEFTAEQPKTVLTQNHEFDRTSLMSQDSRSVSGLTFLSPNRFSMHQSYSMSFSSSSFGNQSAGLYLNTLSYKLADPLTLSADVGFYTPFYSSVPGLRTTGLNQAGMGSSVVFPHVGLEYKPSENTSISLHMFNGPDAAKAYGYPYSPFLYPWAR